MKRIGRRSFLLRSSVAAASAGLPLSLGFAKKARAESPWGALQPDPTGNLAVPPGFTVTVLQTKYETMSDGYVVPNRADGMACFPGAADNQVILMRNHEIDTVAEEGPLNGQPQPAEAYDPTSHGGVTRVVVDLDTMSVTESNLVLTGTRRNCAGGPSPWGWLSCEENRDTADQPHGWVFLCPTDATSVQMPQRIDGYGRFLHEAVAIDPSTNTAYLTEDIADGAFYRFVPDDPNEPFVGKLQALAIKDQPVFNTIDVETGAIFDVEWVDIDDPAPATDSVRTEAKSKGAAIIVRGEGCAFHEGAVYFTSTNGGPVYRGQVFRLIDDPAGATLEVLAQSEGARELDMPDNITVANNGDVYIVEDGDGSNFIRFIDETGQIRDFAENILSISELTGVCFSPDNSTMFVNIQEEGVTLAITGPFLDKDAGADDDGGTGTSGGANDGGDSGCAVDDEVRASGAGVVGAAAAVAGLAALTRGDRAHTNDEHEDDGAEG